MASKGRRTREREREREISTPLDGYDNAEDISEIGVESADSSMEIDFIHNPFDDKFYVKDVDGWIDYNMPSYTFTELKQLIKNRIASGNLSKVSKIVSY